MRGNLPQIIKAIYENHSISIILNWEELETVPLCSGMKQMCPLAGAIRKEKRVKGMQVGKEVKVLLCADGRTPCFRESRNSARKLLEMTNKFSKEAQYKVNLSKSQAFLWTTNKHKENDTLPFTIASKNIKYLGKNLSKDLYNKKHFVCVCVCVCV